MYPYLVFNAVSPNNNGATGKVAVRQAISYGISRSHLIGVLGGPALNPPLTPHPARRHQRGTARAQGL